MPAMIGMRPAACSTAVRISSQCSSKSTVGDSPVVPTMTIPDVPFATWKSISLRSAGRSRAPPGCIGVTMAQRLPLSMKGRRENDGFYPIRPSCPADAARDGAPHRCNYLPPPVPPGPDRGATPVPGPGTRTAPTLRPTFGSGGSVTPRCFARACMAA